MSNNRTARSRLKRLCAFLPRLSLALVEFLFIQAYGLASCAPMLPPLLSVRVIDVAAQFA